ncbi:WD40/YVTN/BNR-like repeat-containing protein [Paenibacillus sp. NPDC056579]|uniref:WD40/YVTN/BNR-like repeat-containing protein n=1 Tax=Paenibacillus sp. NPDC056579 TaxID=3345871 RepID=UPI00369507C7
MRQAIASRFLILLSVFLLILSAGCESRSTTANTSPSGSNTSEQKAGEPTADAAGKPPADNAAPGATATPAPTAPAAPKDGNAEGAAKPSQAGEPAAQEAAVSAVQFISPTEGWAGGPGAVLHTKDGGVTWEKQYGGSGNVESFSFLNSSTGWALMRPLQGSGSPAQDGKPAPAVLLHTVNGGAKWTELTNSAPISKSFRFISEKEGFSGSRYTSDGGATWTSLPVPANIKGEPYYVSKDLGWAVTMKQPDYQIQLTKDGGKTWKTVWTHATVSQVTQAVIQATNAQDVWVLLIGESGMSQTSYTLLHSKDEGKAWKTVVAHSTAGGGPAPGYKTEEQVGPKGPGTKPGQLLAINSDTAYLFGECPPCGDYGTVSAGWTRDGGTTWTNGEQQIPGLNAQASFISDKQGFLLAGSSNMTSTLYKTEDGGKKWTAVQSFGKKGS